MPASFGNSKKDVSQEDFERNMKNSLSDMKDTSNVKMPTDVDRNDYFDAVKKTARGIEAKLKEENNFPYKRINPKVNDGKVQGRDMKVQIYKTKEGVDNASISFGNGLNENFKQLKIQLDDKASVAGVFVSTDVKAMQGNDGTFYAPIKFRRYEDVSNLPKSFELITKTIGFNNPERENKESDLSQEEIVMRHFAKKMGEVNKSLDANSTQKMYIGDTVRDENGQPVVDAEGKKVFGQIFENKNSDGNKIGSYFTIHNKQNEQLRVYLDTEGNLNHVNYNDWNGYHKETKEWDKGCSAYIYNLADKENRVTFGKFTEIIDAVVAELGDKYVAPVREAKAPEVEQTAESADVDIDKIPDLE